MQPILIIIFLILSAFFSSSETALFSLNKLQIRKINISHPKSGKMVTHLLNFPRRTLITILIGNTVVNIAITSITTFSIIQIFGGKGIGLAICLVAFFLLIFGEVVPKSLAIKNAEAFSIIVVRPLEIFARIIFPIRKLLQAVSDFVLSIFIKETTLKKPYITQKELKTLVSISREEGVLEEEEKDMIEALLELGEQEVEEIMIPRTDIVACASEASSDTLIKVMKDSLHTKIPIYSGSLDNIVGMISTREFMLSPNKDLKQFIRPVTFVPETKKVDDLLIELRSKKMTLAIVIDEYGGTEGLVTREDILEEIVGEIYDEYDKIEKLIERIDERKVIVSGKLSIKDVNEQLNLHLPLSKGETLSGLLLALFGHLPSIGEKVEYEGLKFEIKNISKRRIKQIAITKLEKQ